MNAVLAVSTVAPLLAGPSLRHELVTQLVLGEGARLTGRDGDMLRVRTALDDVDGWVHRGYVRETSVHQMESWLATAAWSEGATVRRGEVTLVVPHRARLPLEGPDRVRLPDGQAADILQGRIRPYGEVIGATLGTSPAEWAWQQFAGAPYLWGGVTTAGIDCSGLVQVTFLARGVPLPRNAAQQAAFGVDVGSASIAAGDLLFMRGATSDDISHVAIAVDQETFVHSAVDAGGVTRESWGMGSRAAGLRERLVAVRRLT